VDLARRGTLASRRLVIPGNSAAIVESLRLENASEPLIASRHLLRDGNRDRPATVWYRRGSDELGAFLTLPLWLESRRHTINDTGVSLKPFNLTNRVGVCPCGFCVIGLVAQALVFVALYRAA